MKYLKPIGLAAIAAMALTAYLGAGTASATVLYIYDTPSGNPTVGIKTTVGATVEGSTTFEDTEEDLLVETCTTSEIRALMEEFGSATSHPYGSNVAFTFANCSHTVHVLSKGSLEIRHIAGTTNGTFYLKNAQWTIRSTTFGISCTASIGTATPIGTLVGAKSTTAHATINVNAIIPIGALCGGDVRWTGAYKVTLPTGLMVESS
jgi:hypothetical protein